MRTEEGKKILEAARIKANEIGKPVSIAVIDAAGAMVVFERFMDAPSFTAVVAEGKAAGSAFTGRDSALLPAMAQSAPNVFLALQARLAGQRFAPHQGAVPVKDGRTASTSALSESPCHVRGRRSDRPRAGAAAVGDSHRQGGNGFCAEHAAMAPAQPF